jgi:hypothetical protein
MEHSVKTDMVFTFRRIVEVSIPTRITKNKIPGTKERCEVPQKPAMHCPVTVDQGCFPEKVMM